MKWFRQGSYDPVDSARDVLSHVKTRHLNTNADDYAFAAAA